MAFPQLPADAVGTPISSVYVPNDQFRAIGASTLTQTDTLGNTHTSANFNIQQIGMQALAMSSADGLATGSVLEIAHGLFNGSSIDRRRGNVDTGALISVTSVTTGQTGADQTNYNGHGVACGIYATLGTGTIQVTIQGKDTASGQYYTILQSVATITTATGLVVLSVYPGLTAVTNVSVSALLPRTWRVITTSNATALSYTIGASLIL